MALSKVSAVDHDWEAAEVAKPPPARRLQPRVQETEVVKCPRCDSSNTKFCYYNNYNKSQPRYFCKACKRHWTKGGTLRNVPVGGGRKNKRAKVSSPTDVGPTLTTQFANQNAEAGPVKDMSSIIYEALMGNNSGSVPFNGNGTGLLPENVKTEFQFSSLNTSFDVNASSLVHNNYGYDQFGSNLDSIEESSTITSVNIPTSSPWPESGYWNWSEIDVLTSADHLNILWDDHDAEIKP